ncbi:YihY/virulence factor BrkB family protein [soil metagenome]
MDENKFKIKELPGLLKQTYKEWKEVEPFRLSAVVSYFAIVSLPGLLVIVVQVAGFFFGEAAVEGRIADQISETLGDDAANDIQRILAQATESGDNTWENIFGIATLIFGSTGVFYHLQKSLNRIWDVKAEPEMGLKKLVKDRAFSLGMVLAIGFLLLISLAISSVLSVLSGWIVSNLPDFTIYLFYVVNYGLSLLIVTILFGLIYKYLPDVNITWKVVWVGAAVTAVLFLLSEIALSIYFGNANIGSLYGSAGSLVVMMLWVAYSCMILFFGASFTQVYARRYGTDIRPSEHAVRMEQTHV